VLADQYPDLLPQIAAVSDFANQARNLSSKRNSIVHGLLVHDKNRHRWALRYKDRDFAWDESELEALSGDVANVEDGLSESCYVLWEALEAKRTGSQTEALRSVRHTRHTRHYASK
jgi:hypothetical protein